ncbi:MAG: hypothetical protein IH858_13585 [Chloroflexi bacterium]|nr:hypothetical protein [Chloroflexota bacterium]
MNVGRLSGILFILGGVALGSIGAFWLFTQVEQGGAIVGLFGLAVLVIFLVGIGIFLLMRSSQEIEDAEERAELRKILDMVASKGEVQISELVLELGTSRKEVQGQVHSLVGMGLFSGYINWDEGTLFSSEASSIHELQRCKFCGGEVKFAGKGVLHCPYCGAEYFIS